MTTLVVATDREPRPGPGPSGPPGAWSVLARLAAPVSRVAGAVLDAALLAGKGTV
jgi:hypothetical protein